MEKFVVHAERTVQVTEDEWRRNRLNLRVSEETTVGEIIAWAKKHGADLDSGLAIWQLMEVEES